MQSNAAKVVDVPQQPATRPAAKFTNLTKMWHMRERCPDYLKVVWVTGGVANITNAHLAVRRRVENIPDGAYNVGSDGFLQPTEVTEAFPDLNSIKPKWIREMEAGQQITSVIEGCTIPHNVVGAMIRLSDEVKKVGGDVVITKDVMYCRQNQSLLLQYPFGLTHPVLLNPAYLSLVLSEMVMNYPEVKMRREVKSVQHYSLLKTPLIIGLNWGSMAMMMPLSWERDDG